MEQEKEERLAAILWRFIEEIREREGPRVVLPLTPGEAQELLELLTFAASIGDALAEAECPAEEHGQARRRLELALLERPARSRSEAGALSDRRPPAPNRAPRARSRWTWGTVAAAAVLAAGLVGMQVGRSLPPPDPLTHPPASVLVLSHARVRKLLPGLLKGQLSPQQSRAMWWHLAHCDDCFHAYEQMRGRAPRRMIGARDGGGPAKLGEAGTFIPLRAGGLELWGRRAG
jgi:hypothetical protein